MLNEWSTLPIHRDPFGSKRMPRLDGLLKKRKLPSISDQLSTVGKAYPS